MKVKTNQILKQKPIRLRTDIVRGIANESPLSSSDKGDYGAGVIRGFSVAMRGEAIGHGYWADEEFLHQISVAINRSEFGIKSRFTHPSLSGDGLGKHLGRVKNSRIVGNAVIADLHFVQSANTSPDGSLAEYIVGLAKEDPASFGCSISFIPDDELIGELIESNGGYWDGEDWDMSEFQSPDQENAKNLPHFRLARLAAVDIVDEPALNPDGLFYRGQDLSRESEELLSYCLGMTSQKPRTVELSIDADRAKDFVTRYLKNNSLIISKKGGKMTTETKENPKDTIDPVSEIEVMERSRVSELSRMKSLSMMFGDDPKFAIEQFLKGNDSEAAAREYEAIEYKKIKEENLKLKAELEARKSAAPVGYSPESSSAPSDFMGAVDQYQKENRCSAYVAMREIARKNPELHRAYVDSLPKVKIKQ